MGKRYGLRARLLFPIISAMVVVLISVVTMIILNTRYGEIVTHLVDDDIAVLHQLTEYGGQLNQAHADIVNTIRHASEHQDPEHLYEQSQANLDRLNHLINEIKGGGFETTWAPKGGAVDRQQLNDALDRYYWAQADVIAMLTVDLKAVTRYQREAELAILEVMQLITQRNQEITHEVKLESDGMLAQLHSQAIWVYLSIMALLVFMFLISLAHTGGIVRTLHEIQRAMVALARRKPFPDSFKVTADVPEINEMGRALIDYRDTQVELAEASQSLVRINQELEQRVVDRTQALSKEVEVRRQTEQTLRLYAEAFECTDDAILITDDNAEICFVNRAHRLLSGYRADEVLGRNPRMFRSGRHDRDFYQKMWADLTERGAWQGEIWDRRKNGEIYPKWLTINALELAEGQDRGVRRYYVGVFRDMSLIKQTEARLEVLAYSDPLTGLRNRGRFYADLDELCGVTNNSGFALMLLDLDRFKPVNDRYGHPVGDELLVQIARRLGNCLRDGDTAYRLGGDEFALLFSGVNDDATLSLLAQRVVEVLSGPVKVEGLPEPLRVGASAGIAVAEPGEVGEALVKRTDRALYAAKGQGRGCIEFADFGDPTSAP